MKTVVTFSGAGLSVESGIPTYRAADGLWHNYKISEVAEHSAWYGKNKDQEKVLKFYADRWDNIQDCQPNAAHFALAELQSKYNVINITQNIDDLMERAGCTNVLHLHGSISSRKCEFHKDIISPPPIYCVEDIIPFDEMSPEEILPQATKFICDYKQSHTGPVQVGELCPKCGGKLRPDVVWFHENVDMMQDYIDDLASKADIFIGIGTSAQVQPAASLLFKFRTVKEKYFIDLNPPLRLQSFTRLTGTAGEHLPKVVQDLLSRG